MKKYLYAILLMTFFEINFVGLSLGQFHDEQNNCQKSIWGPNIYIPFEIGLNKAPLFSIMVAREESCGEVYMMVGIWWNGMVTWCNTLKDGKPTYYKAYISTNNINNAYAEIEKMGIFSNAFYHKSGVDHGPENRMINVITGIRQISMLALEGHFDGEKVSDDWKADETVKAEWNQYYATWNKIYTMILNLIPTNASKTNFNYVIANCKYQKIDQHYSLYYTNSLGIVEDCLRQDYFFRIKGIYVDAIDYPVYESVKDRVLFSTPNVKGGQTDSVTGKAGKIGVEKGK